MNSVFVVPVCSADELHTDTLIGKGVIDVMVGDV